MTDNGHISAEETARVACEIKKRTAMPAFRLDIDGERRPALTDTKFGGTPYWPADGADYPRNAAGTPLMLLAQLNMADFGGDKRLPGDGHGLIQLFIDATDGCSGMDFKDSTNQEGFRVVWHGEVDETVTEESVRLLGIVTSTDGYADEKHAGNPVNGEFAVSVTPIEACMTIEDSRFDPLFVSICKELLGEDATAGRLDTYGIVGDENWDALYKVLVPAEPIHRVFGYPFFTQYDPRNADLLGEFDTLLIQIDSEGDRQTRQDRVLWGDTGIANFFISEDALKRGDFSRVLFNWDCY